MQQVSIAILLLFVAGMKDVSSCDVLIRMQSGVTGYKLTCLENPCSESSTEVAPNATMYAQSCPNHCYFSNNTCYGKYVATVQTLISTDVDEFRPTGSGSNNDLGRFFSLTGSPLSGCLQFPQSCNIDASSPYLHLLLEPPVDIPYCQRIKCASMNPLAESNRFQCHSSPGCYFDVELANYRNTLGQAILPGVPVCHQVIRNHEFLRLVGEYTRKSGQQWNGLYTNCLLSENANRLKIEHPGCYMLDVLTYVGIFPKYAGWSGITKDECNWINGCYRITSVGNSQCYYPAEPSQVQVRSGEDPQKSLLTPQNIFGQPLCRPFNPLAPPTEFLTSYHECRAAGCVIHQSITPYKLQEQLQLLAQSDIVPQQLKIQFLTLVQKNMITAENWKEELERMVKMSTNPFGGPGFPGNLGLQGLLGGSNFNQAGSLYQFQQSLNGNNGLPSPPGGLLGALGSASTGGSPIDLVSLLASGLLQGNNEGQTSGLPSGFLTSLTGTNVIPGLAGLGGLTGLTGLTGLGGLFGLGSLGQPSCPFINNGLQLSGKFTGCCEQNLCYIPRPLVPRSYSGPASYWTEWQSWESCSESCAGGVRVRHRRCQAEYSGSCENAQNSKETQACNEQTCPTWGVYGPWSACSASCGGGEERRDRQCSKADKCPGQSYESRPCASNGCPVFGEWSSWTSCATTCGVAQTTRYRDCVASIDYTCPPRETEHKQCKIFCGNLQTTGGHCQRYPNCYKQFTTECLKSDGGPGYCSEYQKRIYYQRCTGASNCYNCLFNAAICSPLPSAIVTP